MVTVPTAFRSRLCPLFGSYNPAHAVTWTVWALPFSLATTCGIILIFSSSGYLDVSVPRVRLPCGIPISLWMGCPIRTSADHTVCAGPRGLSQLATSFFASESLGIPRTPLSTWTPNVPSCTHAGFVRDAASSHPGGMVSGDTRILCSTCQ